VRRIIGPPGCGKTTELARLSSERASEDGNDSVVIASLTRAAATEIAGRDTNIPLKGIGTLHAHALRALDRPTLAEVPKMLAKFNERVSPPWRLSGASTDIDGTIGGSSMRARQDNGGDEILGDINIQRHKLADPTLISSVHTEWWKAWCEFKDTERAVDFTDLLEHALEHVDEHPMKPLTIMVDEAQDFSVLEAGLVRQWGQHTNQTVVVGDPHQALYTWRGADPEAMFGPQERWGLDQEILVRSYRVPAAVHEQAVGFISASYGGFNVEYHPRRDERGREVTGEVVRAPYTWDFPDWLIPGLRAELSDAKTVMVLASCDYMLRPLIAALKARAIPFHNPYRLNNGAWNPMAGTGRLLAFLRGDIECYGPEARMWTWDELRRWTEPLMAKGTLTRGAKALIKAKCERNRIGESRAHQPAELHTVMEMLDGDEAKVASLCHDIGWWETHLRGDEHKRQRFALKVARMNGKASLRETPKLVVGTIHSVKGGEADSVYVWPDLSPAGWEDWRAAGERHDSVRRMGYVAMTRAREKLCLMAPSGSEAMRWA
jgi:ATP-dependent DNA helicase UvrD/PcrA